MSFSEDIETYISWDNINEWKHWQFGVITVEPIPSVIEYIRSSGDLDFQIAVGLSNNYHSSL